MKKIRFLIPCLLCMLLLGCSSMKSVITKESYQTIVSSFSETASDYLTASKQASPSLENDTAALTEAAKRVLNCKAPEEYEGTHKAVEVAAQSWMAVTEADAKVAKQAGGTEEYTKAMQNRDQAFSAFLHSMKTAGELSPLLHSSITWSDITSR